MLDVCLDRQMMRLPERCVSLNRATCIVQYAIFAQIVQDIDLEVCEEQVKQNAMCATTKACVHTLQCVLDREDA